MNRAVVVGFDYYAQFLANLINENSKTWRLASFNSSRVGTMRALAALYGADALISLGGPSPNSALTDAARRRRIPVFIIWAGSDVIKAREDPFELEVTKQEEFVNLSDGPWLVDELREMGVHAEYLPITAVRADPTVAPFPKTFSVLTYLPEPRRAFYGADLVYEAARSLPDVPFTVVGAGERDAAAPENVQFLGHVSDMPSRIDAATVLLRTPHHDGKSMLVLEALARGRHVVWNQEFPYAIAAQSPDAVIDALGSLRERHARGELELNTAGREFVLQCFSRSKVAFDFEQRLNEVVREWRSRPRTRKRRVAISGLGLFCADVSQNVKRFAPEWEPRLMRSSSRLEVLTAINTIAWCDVWYSIGSPITDRWVHWASRVLKKPHVVHWVGSDIAWLGEHAAIRAALGTPLVSHLAEVEWTAAQLREQGLQARIAPLPPRQRNGTVRPLPAQFTVMLYVPRTRADFYGRQSFRQLMKRLADKPIRYVVVGGGEIEPIPGIQLENLGWMDSLDPVYQRASVLIRNTPRDGLSLMVLEALSYGRHVLWTQHFPFTTEIHSYSDMEREICALFDLHERGELRPQAGAAQMIASRYDPRTCTRAIVQAWSDAVERQMKHNLVAEAP